MLAREKLLTVCLYIPADSSMPVEDCLCRVIEEDDFAHLADLIVLAASPERDLRCWLHSLADSGAITVLIDTSLRMGRSRAHLPLFAAVETPYLLALSAHLLLKNGWLRRVLETIRNKDPFDMARLPASFYVSGSADMRICGGDCFLMRTLYQRDSKFPYFNSTDAGENKLLPASVEGPRRKGAAKCALERNDSRELQPLVIDGIDPQTGFPAGEFLLEGKRHFSVTLTGYGDFPALTVAAAESLVKDRELHDYGWLMVGCNTCSSRVIEPLRAMLWEGKLDTLIISNHNYNKCGMQRIFADLVETPYLAVMDDDVEILAGLGPVLNKFIAAHHPFYGGGSNGVVDHDAALMGYANVHQFIESKPWWKGIRLSDEKIFFPMGNFYVASTALLRRFRYPDDKMKVDMEDIILGALIEQQGEAHCHFPKEVRDRIVLKDARTRR